MIAAKLSCQQRLRWPLIGLATLFLLAWGLPAQAQRMALLIGNARYSVGPLTNPPNDVREIDAALRAVGFNVVTVLNANQNEMKRAVRDFGELAKEAEIAFLYYSGHATQAYGENYLIPLGAAIRKEADYDVEAVSATSLMRQIAGARPRAAVVVLDACRDNPYASVTKNLSKGLGRMDAPTGTMIAFATAPNTTAGDEGYYARTLAEKIKTSGLELLDVFRETSAEVLRLSGGRQEPRISEVSINERIYLAGRPPRDDGGREALPPTRPPTALAPGQIIKDCEVCPELVVVGDGSFEMGSNEGYYEAPTHKVILASFLLGKTEVTQGQWKALMGINPSHFEQCDECPVERVSWEDAQAYAKKLSERTGKRYRLPSEAEWEYAARAGTNTRYWWGDAASHEYANYGDREGVVQGRDRWKKTAPVGQFPSNAFGLYDMHGNVREWVQDSWHNSYVGAPADGTAWVVGGGGWRMLRGGSWSDSPEKLRSAFRDRFQGDVSVDTNGFRIARTF